MSRSLPSPPLTSLPFSQIQALANSTDGLTNRSPREWLEQARYEADKAVLAERKGKKEEMFLAYTRAAQAYVFCKSHSDYKEVKRKDPAWAMRVSQFKETYDAVFAKATEVKEFLRARDVERIQPNGEPASTSTSILAPHPDPTRQKSTGGPEVSSLGSIQDRMNALSGKGMDLGNPPKRFSRDLSTAIHTSGAGTFGVARTFAMQEQAKSNAASTSESQAAPTARRPSITPKPQLPVPPKAPEPEVEPPLSPPAQILPDYQSSVRVHQTGSSTRSRASVGAGESTSKSTPPTVSPQATAKEPESPAHPLPTPRLTPSNSGLGAAPNPSPSADPTSRPVLVAALRSPQSQETAKQPRQSPLPPLPKPPALSGRKLPDSQSGPVDFEKAFPSLSEFGKQFEYEAPAPTSARHELFPFEREGGSDTFDPPSDSHSKRSPSSLPNGHREIQLPDVPSFLDLPSVPAGRPGLSAPPSRPEGLQSPDVPRGRSLPSPDVASSIKRPASVPNAAGQPDEQDLLSASPSRVDPKPLPDLKAPRLLSRSPAINGGSHHRPSPSLTFPIAKPTPGPSHGGSGPAPESLSKPKFPLSNAVEAETLRGYILNPAVNMLLLDTRSEEDFSKGYVGMEYEPRGARVNVVWMDPTVLMRNDMNATKLEDSLSLSPDHQRRAFDSRSTADLVVIYDSHSVDWPRKGSQPTPLSKLWDIIYEHEFSKRLERTPVMLVGGYDAWLKFIDSRRQIHAKNHQVQMREEAAKGRGTAPNGHGPQPLVSREINRLPAPPSSASGGELATKRANRDVHVYQPAYYAKNITDSFHHGPQSMTGEKSYGSYSTSRPYVTSSPNPLSPSQHGRSGSASSYDQSQSTIAPPPQASIHPGPGARRRSDYLEQHNQVYSGYASPGTGKASIDYPQAHALTSIPQPPPAAQNPAFDRYDTRPGVIRSGSIRGLDLVSGGGDEVRYWNDIVLGLTGLKNLGNTCYMNSTLQCLSATYPFTSYFLDGSYKKSINIHNPLGTKGHLAAAFAELLKALWKEDYTFLSPVTFRKNIIAFAAQFSGTDQHDSQEFLSFVLDGLHEDLNRIKHKPAPVEMTPEREAALEVLPPEVASEKEWQIYKMRNDSFIVDLFQGQYRNRLECSVCHKTSTTYDPFMYMSLPVPAGKSKVVVQELIDEFVKGEVMDGEDKWNCPQCKVLRRATKTLSIARLPPVLLIQLKRFSTTDGIFWNKSDTPVIFPVNGLDLSRYVARRQPTGSEDVSDPRTQRAPFRYDLYGVSNHMGTLSSGHYTAFVKSSKGWMYCEDSKISKAHEKDVVSKPAYILFYKRIR